MSPTAPIRLDNLLFNTIQNNLVSPSDITELTILDKNLFVFGLKYLFCRDQKWLTHIHAIKQLPVPLDTLILSAPGVECVLTIPTLTQNNNVNTFILNNPDVGLSDLVILNWMKFVKTLSINGEQINLTDILSFSEIVYSLPTTILLQSQEFLTNINQYTTLQRTLSTGEVIDIKASFFSILNNNDDTVSED